MMIRHTTTDEAGELVLTEWLFEPADLPSSEAEDIELVGGPSWETYQEFQGLLAKRHRRAIRAAYWICLRRTDSALRFEDVTFKISEVSWRYDDAYLARAWESFVIDPARNTDQGARNAFYALLVEAGWTGTPDVSVDADPKETPNDSADEPTATENDALNTAGH